MTDATKGEELENANPRISKLNKA